MQTSTPHRNDEKKKQAREEKIGNQEAERKKRKKGTKRKKGQSVACGSRWAGKAAEEKAGQITENTTKFDRK